jgi:hypothetical protein
MESKGDIKAIQSFEEGIKLILPSPERFIEECRIYKGRSRLDSMSTNKAAN